MQLSCGEIAGEIERVSEHVMVKRGRECVRVKGEGEEVMGGE